MVDVVTKRSGDEERARRKKYVRVWATDPKYLVLRHYPSGIGFRADINDGVEWPNDPFTWNRVKDGAIAYAPPVNKTEH